MTIQAMAATVLSALGIAAHPLLEGRILDDGRPLARDIDRRRLPDPRPWNQWPPTVPHRQGIRMIPHVPFRYIGIGRGMVFFGRKAYLLYPSSAKSRVDLSPLAR